MLIMWCMNSVAQNVVTANNDIIQMHENDIVKANVIVNDYGLTNGISKLKIVRLPKHGTAKVLSDYSVEYTPDKMYYGSDSFIYEICNKKGACDQAVVNITIANVNALPIAKNDTVTIYHNQRTYVSVLSNDENLVDLPLSLRIKDDIKNGYCNINSQLELFAEFERIYFGLDSCSYEVIDSDGDRSEAKVIFNVQPSEAANFYLPEAFSPNNDNINDTFYVPEFELIEGIKIEIYNVNGGLIYKHQNYSNDWGGIANMGVMKGKKVKPGTYFYFFNLPGNKERISGFIYLSY